jgi:ABC-type uncharacterized transport system auxiliary subunit
MRPLRRRAVVLAAIACVAGAACQLRRPDTIPIRMIEPQLVEPPRQGTVPDATPIRLVETRAREHIGRRILWRQTNGELVEDPIWRWSSMPERYLDTALRLELESSPSVRLVDASDASLLAATLLVWALESSRSQLVGAVEFQFTGTDRVVRAHVVQGSEPVSSELPGDLAAAAGRLFHRLASEGLTRATHGQ